MEEHGLWEVFLRREAAGGGNTPTSLLQLPSLAGAAGAHVSARVVEKVMALASSMQSSVDFEGQTKHSTVTATGLEGG